VRYEWAEGGQFLFQHIDITPGGHAIKGLEVIGHIHTLDGDVSADVHSRVSSSMLSVGVRRASTVEEQPDAAGSGAGLFDDGP
jgi:hypothetical protein